MKKYLKPLLWANFMLMMSFYLNFLKAGVFMAKVLNVVSVLLFIGAILFAGYSWFMDFIDEEDSK